MWAGVHDFSLPYSPKYLDANVLYVQYIYDNYNKLLGNRETLSS